MRDMCGSDAHILVLCVSSKSSCLCAISIPFRPKSTSIASQHSHRSLRRVYRRVAPSRAVSGSEQFSLFHHVVALHDISNSGIVRGENAFQIEFKMILCQKAIPDEGRIEGRGGRRTTAIEGGRVERELRVDPLKLIASIYTIGNTCRIVFSEISDQCAINQRGRSPNTNAKPNCSLALILTTTVHSVTLKRLYSVC